MRKVITYAAALILFAVIVTACEFAIMMLIIGR